MSPPEGRAHVHGPANPEGDEDGDIDVRGEEVLRVPREEDLVAADKDEDRRPEHAPDSEPRLQWAVIRELGAIAALYLVSTP